MKKNAARRPRWLGATLGVALLASALPVAAQPNLDGVWSGIFTTRHDPYWKVEDWLCFWGCTEEGLAHAKALLADPKNDAVPVFALLGQAWGWEHQKARENLVGKSVELYETLSDKNDPSLNCQPYGFAREVTNALPIKITHRGKSLVIEYEEWSEKRTIYLDGRAHPKNLKPTRLGHSIGHWDGDVLAVDTVGLSPDFFYYQYYGGGFSENAHATERYTVFENPRRLRLDLTLEDATMLKTPFVVHKIWLYKPEMKLVRDSCKDYPTKP